MAKHLEDRREEITYMHERSETPFEDVMEEIRSMLLDARISELQERVKPPKMTERAWLDYVSHEKFLTYKDFSEMNDVQLLTLYIKELVKEGVKQ